MAGPIETLTQQLIRRVTDPSSLALLAGVTSSSFWLFGSLALAMDGALAATVTESERAKKGISETSALKMWEWVFNRAMVRFLSVMKALYPCITHRSFRRYISHRPGSLAVPSSWQPRPIVPTYDPSYTGRPSSHSQPCLIHSYYVSVRSRYNQIATGFIK